MKIKMLIFFFLLVGMTTNPLKAQQAGSLDNSFGTGGTVLSFFSTFIGITYGDALAVQNDGKILVAGRCTKTLNGQILSYGGVLARFNTNGANDNSFYNFGFIDYLSDPINSMVLQSNGNILTVDNKRTRRFKANGSQNSFGNGLDVEGGQTIKLQSDGKIIIGRTVTEGTNTGFLIARYTTEGIRDSSFGVNGVSTKYFRGSPATYLYCMTIQKDDKIILAGYEYVNGTVSPILARFNKNGSINNSLTMSLGVGSKIYSIDTQADGKLIGVGIIGDVSTGYTKMVIFRFQADGFSLDNSFGNNGVFIPSLSSGHSEAKSVVIQSDNKILVSGYAYNNISNSEDFAVLKIKSNGTLDNTFGTNGIVNTDIQRNDVASCIAVQNDGKIVLAGTTFKSNNEANISIARYFNTINVGTQNINNSVNSIKVYPNPVSNFLSIKTQNYGTFQVLNLLGQQVLNGTASEHIDVSALQKGVYVLRIGEHQAKFVKE
jgi:uncharacterized delta-60 repeat protein